MNAWPQPVDLADASAEPAYPPAFTLVRAAEPQRPVVLASPHSGRLYPRDLMAASRLDADEIRRSEDVLVDELAAGAPPLGIPLLLARYARAYVDVNREPYELDAGMYEDDLPAFARSRSARVAAGLGAIARVVGDGQEIYARKLNFAEARARIEAVHRPYHHALADLVGEVQARFGFCVLIDWHSMPSAAGIAAAKGGRPADFVLGDRFSTACGAGVTRLVERALEGMGYAVARNVPYAGGYTTEFYGRPGRGVHALQVEINRALYLDEATLEPGAGCARLTDDLQSLFQALSGADWRAML